ncbi:MAG: sporulation protein YunB [Ruminococcus sp.]|nr:sporulation protein YunB [Ruminococcus sp.]
MKRRTRKNPQIRRVIGGLIFVSVIILLIFSFIKLDKAVRPSAQMQAEQLSEHTAYQIITDTVSRYIAESDCTYSKFSTIVYDEYGNVSSVEALAENINFIQSELTSEINENLHISGKTQAEIPLGNISGSYLLADKGPVIKIGICPVGTAEVKLVSTFDTAGINQTRHRIYAEISADMASSFPLYSFETKVKFDYLIAETIIIGDVPDYSVRAWAET